MFAGQLQIHSYPGRSDLIPVEAQDMPLHCTHWPVPEALGQYGCGMGLANLLVFPTGAQNQIAQLAYRGIRLDSPRPEAVAMRETVRDIYETCLTLRSVPARIGCLHDSAHTLSRTHEAAFSEFSATCALLPKGYELSCPRAFGVGLGEVHDRGVHLQVEALLLDDLADD